jgi:hypothetical protein
MSDLEQMLRDQFASDAERAPLVQDITLGATRRALRVRRTRRLAASIAAAAAAVVVLAASAWINASPTAGNRPVQHPVHVPKPVPIPQGQRLVSYHGIEIQVPKRWFPHPVECGVSTVDTVVVETNLDYPCPPSSGIPPISLKITVVQLVPDALAADVGLARLPVTVNGISGLTGTGAGHGRTASGISFQGRTVTVLSLPDPGVLIEVTSPIPGMAQKIFDTVRLAPTDYLGCAASLPTKLPIGNPPSASVMGDKIIARVVACGYVPRLSADAGPPYWLDGSRLLTAEQISGMVETLHMPTRRSATPATIAAVDTSSANFTWYRITYRDGTTRTAFVTRMTEAWTVFDGQRWVSISGISAWFPVVWGG